MGSVPGGQGRTGHQKSSSSHQRRQRRGKLDQDGPQAAIRHMAETYSFGTVNTRRRETERHITVSHVRLAMRA